MKLFEITYTDSSSETQKATFRGYNYEHAEERFLDSMDDEGGSDGVTVISVIPIKSHFIKAPYT